MEPIHFFRAGRHTTNSGQEIAFSQTDLDAIAREYDPVVHEAPLVVGHPSMDAPAYGWVKSVIAREDGLYAEAGDVQPAFADMVRSGAYRKVSGSFYPPNAKNNPRPGSYYLRHIGFLGAAAPAIKGLRPVSFGDDMEALDFQEHLVELREHSLRTRELAMAAREAAFRGGEDAKFVNDLVHGGRLPIGLREMAVAVFAEMDDRRISFGEGDDRRETSPRELLRGILGNMPLPVITKELSGGSMPDEAGTNFAAPPGYAVNIDGLAIHSAALAYQQEHNCSYIEAVQAVEARGR